MESGKTAKVPRTRNRKLPPKVDDMEGFSQVVCIQGDIEMAYAPKALRTRSQKLPPKFE